MKTDLDSQWSVGDLTILNTLQADKLKELGVRKIFAVAVAPPNKVQDWAETCGMDNNKVCSPCAAIASKH